MQLRILLLSVIFFASIGTGKAQSSFKVYSGFIYHFTKYTQWPSSLQSGDFVIGVIGSSEMKKELETLATQKKVGSRKIVVKEFTSAADVGACHILFLGKAKHGELGGLLSATKSNSTLVITEKDGAAKQGAIVNFIEASGRVRFELNKTNAAAHNLKISSDLERLAIVIE
jgi:hypothetical protein